jgi:hypothetical protein
MAYNSLANIGKLKAQIGLGISVCLALSLCASGAFTLKSYLSDKHTATTRATIMSTSCPPSGSCPASANYTVDSKTYTINGAWTVPLPSAVPVSYDPKNPEDSSQDPPSISLSIILVCAALCVVVIGYVVYTLTMAYKPLAAVEGASAIYTVGKGLF